MAEDAVIALIDEGDGDLNSCEPFGRFQATERCG